MHKRQTRHRRWLALALVPIITPLAAQPTNGELAGAVRDAGGLGLAGVRLTVTNIRTGAAVSVTSDAGGRYRFLALTPGAYRLEAAKEGFAALRREGITLRAGDHASLDAELQVGEVSQAILVNADAPLLQAARGASGMVVEERKVATLPLDGRNFVSLIALSPGVSLPPGQLLPRINGSRPRVNEYIYDGISVLQPEPGLAAFYPVVDAIAEVRVETNSFAAEFGRSNGGVIIVNQKAGTNEWRGTMFEFFRHEALNARNLFAAPGAIAAEKPRFRRNQYGFVAGGPVRKNRTFLLADWQGTRLRAGVVRTSTVPTTAQRRGVFAQPVFDPASTRRTEAGYARDAFPNNAIPAARFDEAALAVAGRYPAPNLLAGGNEAVANNYRRVGMDTTAQEQFDGRLDHHVTARQRLFGRVTAVGDTSTPATPLPDGSGAFAAPYIGHTVTRAAGIAAEHTWVVSPAAVHQFRFGFTRRGFRRSALRTGQAATAAARVPGLPLAAYSDVLPSYDVTGLQQLGPPASANADFTTSVTQWLDTYTRASSRHNVKAGADLRWERLDVLQPPSPTGSFQFTSIFSAALTAAGAPVAGTGHSMASFLLGQVTRFAIDVQTEVLKPRAAIAEFFVQDDWRLTRRLILNPGVRYTLNFPSKVEGNRGAVFNLATQRLDYLGQNGFPRAARNLEKTNFGPRLGLAFRAADAFAIRAGYGLIWIEQAGITTPFTTPFFPFIQTLSEQTLDNLRPAFVLSQGPAVKPQPPGPDAGLGQGVFGVQRDNGSGYAQQWNVSLQRTWGANWSLEAGYLGSKLTRLGVPDVNLNQLTAEQLRLGAALSEPVPNPHAGQVPANSTLGTPSIARAQLLKPYPRFTSVALYRNNTGHSTYHSLQGRVEKRFSRGLTFHAAYTFAKLIDDAGAVFDAAVLTGPAATFQAADSFNKRLEKDVSTGHLPHIFSAGGVFEAPWGRGWQVGWIVRLQSGSPVAVTQAANLNAFAGFGVQRPNRVAAAGLPAAERTTARYFNVQAFAAAPQFTLGSSSRNPVSGPAYRTADVMLGKSFRVGERWRTELRAEAFNVTNTPPLGNPNGSFGSPAFGSITSALDPRVFELVLKLHF